jgi:hypothetical protein
MESSFVPKNMGYKNPGATPNLRGVERNTARGVTEPLVLKEIVKVEYAPNDNQTQVVPFDTYGDD